MVGDQSLGAVAEAKAALRRDVLSARVAMDPTDRVRQSAAALSRVLETWPLQPGDQVAAYASFGTEPSTSGLREALTDRGVRVLLPVVLADNDLDWTGSDEGPSAIASCALVITPGLAADRAGNRLGRGGGSYDRALARVGAHVPRVLLLYRGELRDAVPHEPHDERVTHVVQPDGLTVTSAWLGT